MQYLVIRRHLLKVVLGAALLCSSVGLWADENIDQEQDTLVIRYPKLDQPYGQTRPNYFLELLNLALQKSGRNYRLEPVLLSNFRESRSVMSVAKGMYDIHWMNTNPTRETVLRPIRVPLFKGLIGWRLLMLREQDQDRFAGMSNLDPLKSLITVQGHDWPDSEILEHNGLKVIRTSNWEGMFKMLYAGRVDYFPRSVVEAGDEQKTFSDLKLTVDEHVVLVYPSAYYFFVNRDNKALAEVIEQGLIRAIEDGSFDRVLMAHFGDNLQRAQLDDRRIIRLNNPLMTPETPLDRRELWYQP